MAARVTLDVPERQILVRYEGDAIPWHHRVLLVRLEGARWVWATPDLDVQVGDLSQLEIRALGRAAPFPGGLDVYAFDEPILPVDLGRIRAEGRDLAGVLGVTVPVEAAGGGAEAQWLFADPSHAHFDREVADAIMGDEATAVVRERTALVCFEGEWTFAEQVEPGERDDWRHQKRAGAGRDDRLTGGQRPDSRRRPRLLREAYEDLVPVGVPSAWPFKGPRAIVEFLEGVMASGCELTTFNTYWSRSSGVGPSSAVCHEHGVLLGVLNLMLVYDGLNVVNLASAEQVSRRLLMIERAVRRNPRAPDFEGLEIFLSNTFDSAGGVITSEFDKHIAEVRRNDATVMKQERLWKEEVESDRRKKKDRPGGKPGSSETS